MILILTNTDDLTSDYVILRLQERKIPYFRFNIDRFPTSYRIHRRYVGGEPGAIESSHGSLNLTDVSVIWYRRLLLPPVARVFEEDTRPYIQHESRHFLEGLFLSLEVPWVNPLEKVHVAERKLYQIRCAVACGLPVPETIVSNNAIELKQFAKTFPGAVICKPVYSGLQLTGHGAFSAYTQSVTMDDLQDDEVLDLCPTLLQRRIGKDLDIRLTLFGEKAFAVAITGECNQQPLDWRRPGTLLRYELTELPVGLMDRCKQLMRDLGLVYGAMDLVRDSEGKYYFLEVNPTGEWAWLDDAAGLNLRDELIDFLRRRGE